MRYFIELAYNGSTFCGWQIQPNAPTVQGTINECMSKMLGEDINVQGCGRTDTGVHASYFVAHFDIERDIDCEQFVYKLNRFLPSSIVVYSMKVVDPESHSRFSAMSRSYKYYLTTTKNPFANKTSFLHASNLDFELMNKAAKCLLDYTDFTSFSKLHTDVKTNNCKVTLAQWSYNSETDMWVFTITADRFLRNMVRAIVGTLLKVGKGQLSINDFCDIIEAKDRSKAGSSALAHALFLHFIEYPKDIFTPSKNLN